MQLNPDVNAFNRTYVAELRRLEEMARRIRFCQSEIDEAQLPVSERASASSPCKSSFSDSILFLISQVRPFEETQVILNQRPGPELIDELDPRLRQNEERLRQMRDNWDSIRLRALELEEARHVLMETAVFFRQAENNPSAIMDDSAGRSSYDEGTAPLLENAMEHGTGGDASGFAGMSLEFVSGTIDRARMATFERVLWRVLRGNLYMNYAE